MINAFSRKLLLLSACSVAVGILLSLALAHGLLSPREFGFTLLILCVSIASWAALIIRKLAREHRVALGVPIDKQAREQRLRDVKRLKIAVVVLVLLLLNGLRHIRNGPLLPLMVGIGINLFITFTIIRVINRLQKSLK